MDVIALADADRAAVRSFFARIPEGDRSFFRDDVLEESTLDAWVADTTGRRLVAVDEASGEVGGYGAVLPGVGWTSHVGELRVVVDPNRRRQGVGRLLARRGLLEAIDLGLGKVVVEVVADDEPSLAMFMALGFQPEALLKCHIQSRTGEVHDLLMLAHPVDDTWAAMATAGIDEALS